MTEPSKNIVIVGGGFGGSTVARELRARLPNGYMLILISEESYLTFNPMLAEVVGASIFPEQVVAPLRQMLDLSGSSRFIMGHNSRLVPLCKQLTIGRDPDVTDMSPAPRRKMVADRVYGPESRDRI